MSRLFACLLFPVLLSAAWSEEPYASGPIRLIVPFPPGSVAQTIGGSLAETMEKHLGQRVSVVNRPRASGAFGMAAVAKSAPDGRTILMAASSISLIPLAHRIIGRQPLYDISEFAPIALITEDSPLVLVRADGPYESVSDLIAAARTNPAKIKYSSPGVYSPLHVAMEVFAQATGVKLVHVPYQGGGAAITALLFGQVEALASEPAAAIRHINAGKMRALATWATERLKSMPDLPTLKGLGYDAEFYIWSGVFAPAKTPEPILMRLREAVRHAAHSEEFRAALEAVSMTASYRDAPEFTMYLERDAARLKLALEKIGRVHEK